MKDISELDILKFDSVKMDTKLAEEYLKENTEFHDTRYVRCKVGNEKIVLDSCNNKIFCIDDAEPLHFERYKGMADIKSKLMALAEKIRSNEELFAQLNYMIRGRSSEETKIHLDLVIKQILYWSVHVDEIVFEPNSTEDIIVNENTQLLSLGVIAERLIRYSYVIICATPQMAVLCHLFTSLCHEIRLENVYLKLPQDQSILSKNPFGEESGCVAVVTERSDWESALEVLLGSDTMSPWRLTQIFIQESIYEDFKRVLKWKSKEFSSKEKQFVHDAYEFGTNIVVLDSYGAEIDINKMIRVDAYRNNTEVLSMLKVIKPGYFSLWTSDLAEGHEIVHKVDSKVVWVNDYGFFDGPVEISYPIYHFDHVKGLKCKVLHKDSKSVEAWNSLSFERKQQLLLALLKNYEDYPDMDTNSRELMKLIMYTLKYPSRELLFYLKGSVWIGVRKPIGMLCLNNTSKEYISEAISSVLYGNSVAISPNIYKQYHCVWNLLVNSEAPVYAIEDQANAPDQDSEVTVCQPSCFTWLKMIWMNYGST